jgi:hypothetical protein
VASDGSGTSVTVTTTTAYEVKLTATVSVVVDGSHTEHTASEPQKSPGVSHTESPQHTCSPGIKQVWDGDGHGSTSGTGSSEQQPLA